MLSRSFAGYIKVRAHGKVSDLFNRRVAYRVVGIRGKRTARELLWVASCFRLPTLARHHLGLDRPRRSYPCRKPFAHGHCSDGRRKCPCLGWVAGPQTLRLVPRTRSKGAPRCALTSRPRGDGLRTRLASDVKWLKCAATVPSTRETSSLDRSAMAGPLATSAYPGLGPGRRRVATCLLLIQMAGKPALLGRVRGRRFWTSVVFQTGVGVCSK